MSNGLGGEGHPGGVREGAEVVRGIFRPERDKAGGEGQPGGSPRKRACGSTQVRIYGLPQGAIFFVQSKDPGLSQTILKVNNLIS